MKCRRNLLFIVILALLLCVSILAGCNSGPVNPDQEQPTSAPVIDDSSTETTGPGQDQIPDDPEEDDSAIGDRNDDLEIPFG